MIAGMKTCDRSTKVLYGLSFEVCGFQSVLQALGDRFMAFPIAEAGSADIRFEYSLADTAEGHSICRPPGRGRSFYKAEFGEATYFPLTDECYLDCGPRIRVACQTAAGLCRVSLLGAESEDVWLATHPLFTLPFLEMLKRRGKYGIHAAGFARNGRSVLLVGTSGAGKSTLTLAMLRAGFDMLGDDLTFLETGNGITALAFPEGIDITEETLSFFPELRVRGLAAKRPGWPKYQLRVSDYYSAKIAWKSEPAAIVFPAIADADCSSLTPLRPDEAFLELSPSVLLTSKDSTRAHLSVFAELAKSVPAYRMLTGRNFDDAARVLAGLVS